MYVSYIKLVNFRNYSNVSFEFDNNINYIIGKNGKGKTNLLESIYFLSATRSFKTKNQNELISINEKKNIIFAEIFDDINKNEISVNLEKNFKKVTVNNKIIKQSSDLLSIFYAVFFSENDIEIIQGTPAERRYYLDIILSKIDKEYIYSLKSLKRLIKQKNNILKTTYNSEIIDVYNTKIEIENIKIVSYRKNIIKFIEEELNIFNKSAKNNIGKVKIEYKQSLLNFTEKEKQTELNYRECLYGAHRDDFIIYCNEMDAKKIFINW